MECDVGGLDARPDVCARAGVRRYPTWVIDGKKYEGLLTPPQLAQESRFVYAVSQKR